METVRLILKLAVGFYSVLCTAVLWGLLLLPAMTTSGWMIWKQNLNCWLPKTSKNSAFGFFRSNTFSAEPLWSLNSFSVSAVMRPYSIFTWWFLQLCVYRNGAQLFLLQVHFCSTQVVPVWIAPYTLTQSFNWCKSFNAQSFGAWNLKEDTFALP